MRGRFAPSPTGYLHLGNVWGAFLCWLQVRQAGGTLVLRIEDIDEQRSRPEYAESLMDDLTWLGIDWDEGPRRGGAYGPYIQQKRYDCYSRALEQLRELGLIYPCYCSRARLQAVAGAPHVGDLSVYDGHCYHLTAEERRQQQKSPSWRVHVSQETICFQDGLYGPCEEYLPRDCGDFVVRRADGLYAYQLAVSVDDGAMGISHVLRGCDLLSSTARQIWLLKLLGYTPPQYTHIPLLVDGAGNRLSKRQQGITVRQLRRQGLQGTEILSYLAFRGGLTATYENFSKVGLLEHCRLARLQRNPIVIPENIADTILKMREKD